MASSHASTSDQLVASRLVTQEQLSKCQSPDGVALDGDDLLVRLIRENVITKWQAQQIKRGKTKSFFLDHYKLMHVLGVGGMGQVFAAVDTRLNRQVAVKVVSQSSALAKENSRFLKEAKTSLTLQHNNIIRTFELGQKGSVYYLVMELIDGFNVRQFVEQRGKLDVRQTALIGYQALMALDYAHKQGIIHRDIKPSNIMLTKSGQVKLADLGLAKSFGHDAQTADDMTRTGAFMGTVDFCAPEQAEDAKRAEAASDIYSMGCTLYYCLTGQPPFAGGTEVQKIVAHREHEARPIQELNPDVPANLAQIIHQRMLAKKPSDRYLSAADAAQDLRFFAADPTQQSENLLDEMVILEKRAKELVRPEFETVAKTTSRGDANTSTRDRSIFMPAGHDDSIVPRAIPLWVYPTVIASSILLGVLLTGFMAYYVWSPKKKLDPVARTNTTNVSNNAQVIDLIAAYENNEWTDLVKKGSWSLQRDAYQIVGASGAGPDVGWSYPLPKDTDSFEVEMTFRLAGQGAVHIVFNEVADVLSGTGVLLSYAQPLGLSVGNLSSSGTDMNTVPLSPLDDGWHTMRIQIASGSIAATLDNGPAVAWQGKVAPTCVCICGDEHNDWHIREFKLTTAPHEERTANPIATITPTPPKGLPNSSTGLTTFEGVDLLKGKPVALVDIEFPFSPLTIVPADTAKKGVDFFEGADTLVKDMAVSGEKKHQGRIDFEVKTDGIVVVATYQLEWGDRNLSGGPWRDEVQTRDQLLQQGWFEVGTLNSGEFLVIARECKAGDKLYIRTKKYTTPRILLPLAVASKVGPPPTITPTSSAPDPPPQSGGFATVKVNRRGTTFLPLKAGEATRDKSTDLIESVPPELSGLQFRQYQPKGADGWHNNASLAFEIDKPGIVMLAITDRWGAGGSPAGGWQGELISKDEFLKQSWTEVCKLKSATYNRTVYQRVCQAGEGFNYRTEKYEPPMLILRDPAASFLMVKSKLATVESKPPIIRTETVATPPSNLPNGIPVSQAGLIGRMELVEGQATKDLGYLIRYLPADRPTRDSVAPLLAAAGAKTWREGVRFNIILHGVLHLDKATRVTFDHRGGSSTAGVDDLFMNSTKISSVGDDVGGENIRAIDLQAGDYTIRWNIRGGDIGTSTLDITDESGIPLPVYHSQQQLDAAKAPATTSEVQLKAPPSTT